MTASQSDRFDDALDWFLTGFTARDLAEPLYSVDESSPAAAAQAALANSHAEVLGIRRSGAIAGWLSVDDLQTAQDLSGFRPFVEAAVVAERAPLSDVVCSLNAEPKLFVRTFGQISGVISRSAIEKPPARMWLFGLITLTEQRVTRMIELTLPEGRWQEGLSEGRLAKARELQELRERRGQRRSLLDCLQFADKGQIVARNEVLRSHTRFHSRAEVERFVQALQDLRNNLAHAQDILGDWDIIQELAANVQRIVCGGDQVPVSSNKPV